MRAEINMDKIGIIFGGRSTEHEISRLSAAAVINAADKSKHELVYIGIDRGGDWFTYDGPVENIADGSWEETAEPLDFNKLPDMIDFAYPVLHGAYGEDGRIQGLFEMMDIPYAGSGVLGSALAMDKMAAKQVFTAAGILNTEYVPVYGEEVAADVDAVAKRCEENLPYPMFVKPVNLGSSVGISKVENTEELKKGLEFASEYDRRIIVERGLDARELETGVIGNDQPIASGVGEIRSGDEFYDYEAKYSDDAGTVIDVPADIPDEIRETIRTEAVKAYKALDCAGLSRVDFMLEKSTGKVYLNEINTLPGCTKYSMFPMLWNEEGVSFTELIERIIEYGYERYNSKNNRKAV